MDMEDECLDYLKSRLAPEQYQKLVELGQPDIYKFVADTERLCKPADVFITTDSADDREFTRRKAVPDTFRPPSL